jgi:hypothetical protein
MDAVKILALDEDDLPVISAHMQDAVVRIGDINYSAKNRQFVLVANRFDWAEKGVRKSGYRRRTGVSFSRVEAVRSHKIRQGVNEAVLSLLAIEFKPAKTAPAGTVQMVFSGGGVIELDVECIEVEMEDLGPRWGTANTPTHDQE